MNQIFPGKLNVIFIVMTCMAIVLAIALPFLGLKLFLDLFDSFMFPGGPKNLTSPDSRYQVDLYNAHHYSNDIFYWEYRILDKEDKSREKLFGCWTENKHKIIKWSDEGHFLVQVIEPNGYEEEVEIPMDATPQDALNLLQCRSVNETYDPKSH